MVAPRPKPARARAEFGLTPLVPSVPFRVAARGTADRRVVAFEPFSAIVLGGGRIGIRVSPAKGAGCLAAFDIGYCEFDLLAHGKIAGRA